MFEKSETNTWIKYFGYFVMAGSMVAMVIAFFVIDNSTRWMIGAAIFVAGAFNALLLFAISEVLTRLQEIEYNTRKNKDEIEHQKASN